VSAVPDKTTTDRVSGQITVIVNFDRLTERSPLPPTIPHMDDPSRDQSRRRHSALPRRDIPALLGLLKHVLRAAVVVIVVVIIIDLLAS